MFDRHNKLSSSDTDSIEKDDLIEKIFKETHANSIHDIFENTKDYLQVYYNLSETKHIISEIILESHSSSLKEEKEDLNSVLERFHNQYTINFISIILEQDFEYGYESKADLFIENLMKKNNIITKTWLNDIFLDYFHIPKIIIGVLQVLSHIDYYDVIPQGPTIAVAALTHKNAEVRETGVRCFENWAAEESLSVLQNLRDSEDWLQDYINQVIEDLQHQTIIRA
jgi:hypothetical protein